MRTRGTLMALLGAALAAAGAAPVPAAARLVEVTVRQGPIELAPYEVAFSSKRTQAVPSPRLDGWLVRMHARLVNRTGRPLPVSDVMLHHVVYKNASRRDPVCRGTQSFYGTGEENQALDLPRGYGYRLRARDRWRTGWMLMNHRGVTRRAFIEYTASVETSRRLRPVIPYWARVTGCAGRNDPIFNVPGGLAPGSTHHEAAALSVPHSGRIVAAGSHLHGGARGLLLRQPSCRGRRLLASRPRYGLPNHPYYNVLPVLHEPGPIATGWISSRAGVPVRRGERLEVEAIYDGERPHARVMGIWHLYLAPGRAPAERCPELPRDRREKLPQIPGRGRPPAVTVPLTGLDRRGRAVPMLRPPGPVLVAGAFAEVIVGNGGYSVRNLSVAQGGTVRWSFRARGLHDVTVASGPRGFASRWSRRGQKYSQVLATPGEYRLFCSLHPIAMNQVIDVRAGP